MKTPSAIEACKYRKSARNLLLENVKNHPYLSNCDNSVYTHLKGKRFYLPAYIPYIGPDYFSHFPKIICYAINQNLSPHVSWTNDWIDEWSKDFEYALDRLNLASKKNRPIPIKPYVEGFISLVALIANYCWVKSFGGELPNSIDDIISVTNFIKFSTDQDASSSSIPNFWWKECGDKYVKEEIKVLKPDIIIAFGQKTYKELQSIIENRKNSYYPKLIGCRFPARIASNKGRPLTKEEQAIWRNQVSPLICRIRQTNPSTYHKCKIENYCGYYVDAFRMIKTEFENLAIE
ncbi:MAG: hypothetical protein KJ757_03960 [Planctomycetes bacterium]|nr:hypothetical protein [Planctomycetota bacterium]MBU1517367.1 hypothetical protein [Planctomycetota bacterium]MBU2457674.1 hypothetical protein [Planctomycetota bacterium]MBU2596700.1 hypothetical protein [Planctomycetota bacterium]